MLISLKIPKLYLVENNYEVSQTQIDLDISFEELQFLRQYEPVAWTELMAGLAWVGFVVASMKADI